MSTESLIIELDAKTAKLDAKLKQTENRLDQLDGTVKKTDQSFLNLEKAGQLAAKGVTMLAAAGTAASAALVAATVAAVSYSKELRIASNRSGENVEKLQSLAFATKTVGIDLEKLGDITKDTRERIGEFTAEGTGGFNDFVKVAKLTTEEANTMAREFQHLTGTEVLQKMVERMEDAGATANEMSFALEGVASDTTDLIPLLVNGGEKLAGLEKDFNDLGVTLTKLDIDKITALGKETALLGEAVKGSSAKVVSVLSDDIAQITKLMAGSAKDMGGLVIKAVTGYQALVVSGTSKVLNYFRETRIRMLEDKAFLVGIFGDNTKILAEVKKLKESDVLRDAFDAEYVAGQWDVAKEKIKEYYGELRKQNDDTPPLVPPPIIPKSKEKLDEVEGEEETDEIDAAKAAAEQAKKDRELEKLREFLMTRAELLDQQLIDDLARLALAGEKLGVSEEDMFNRRLELIKDFAGKKEALEKKTMGKKEKDVKTEEGWSKSSTKKMMDDGTALLTSIGNNGKTAHKLKQGLAAANAYMNTAEGVTKALAEQNYPGAVLTAVTGAAQIAAIMSSTPDGGSAGASISPPSAPPPAQPDFIPETSSLELSDATESGAQSQINITVPDGDDIGQAIATWIMNAQKEGRV